MQKAGFQDMQHALSGQQEHQQPSSAHGAAGAAQAEGIPKSAQLQQDVQYTAQAQRQQQQQQQQAPVDCLGCRVTGLMLGLGGAGYVSSRLFEDPRPRGAHRFTLITVSAGLFALGVSRALGL